MKQIRTWFNPIQSPSEKTSPVSKTVPDSTLPLRTIVERYASNLPGPGANSDGYYDGEDDPEMPDLRTFDLVDLESMYKANKDIISGLKTRINQERAEAKQAAIEAEIARQRAEAEKYSAAGGEQKSTNLP